MSRVEVRTQIAASPERVWDLIGDPTRMGEWSPECSEVAWISATAARAGVGARFRGHNRNGRRRWSTRGTITEFEPQRAIGWEVDYAGLPVSHWAYRIDADEGSEQCELVETFEDRRGRGYSGILSFARGVKDVEAHNRGTMRQTLAQIKAAAERS